MDPINPWIDPSETRRMAERLMLPAREPVVAPDEAGFDDSFVGFSDVMADDTPAPSPESPAPAGPDAFPQQREWIRKRFSAVACFMIDPQGSLVFNDGRYGAFHFLARDLASSSSAPNHIRVKVGANTFLEIIPVESEGGRAWLGVVVPSLLTPDSVGQIHKRWLAGP